MLTSQQPRPSPDGPVLATAFRLLLRSTPGLLPRAEWLLLLGAFLALTFSLQMLAGAYGVELAQFPDEPSHVVTSLMFGDYVRAGFPESPSDYAERYYVHYPKVAIGMWPPGFYCVAAAWTLLFGTTRGVFLALSALIAALWATSLAIFVKRQYGAALGILAGLVLLLLRPVQWDSALVMLDAATGLTCFWSMMLLIAYFRTERTSAALGFGGATAGAMLVKTNALSCVPMTAIMLLLTGRYRLLKKPGLYAAGIIVLLLGIPWHFFSLSLRRHSIPMAPTVSSHYLTSMMAGYLQALARQFTPLVAVLVVVGLAVALWPPLRRTCPDPLSLAGAASLLLGVIVFHCLEPSGMEPRYLRIALAPGIALFVAGCRYASLLRIPLLPSVAVRCALIAGVSLASAWLLGAFALPRLERYGWIPAADAVLASNVPKNAILVCSDSSGEGGLISELALKDRKLSRIVLRASKVIYRAPWTGRRFKMLFTDASSLAKYLDDLAVDVVVIDLSARSPARELLWATLQQNSAQWHQAQVPGKHTRRLLVFSRRNRSHLVPGPIRFSVPYTLGRDVVLDTR